MSLLHFPRKPLGVRKSQFGETLSKKVNNHAIAIYIFEQDIGSDTMPTMLSRLTSHSVLEQSLCFSKMYWHHSGLAARL